MHYILIITQKWDFTRLLYKKNSPTELPTGDKRERIPIQYIVYISRYVGEKE